METSMFQDSAGGQSDANAPDPGVRVTLQLAGRTDREHYGLAGHLIASMGAGAAHSVPRELVGLIHIERPTGELNLDALTSATELSPQDFERMKSAIHRAWRTAANVDVVDELGQPLLQGALNAHPTGVSRWLVQPSRPRIEREGVVLSVGSTYVANWRMGPSGQREVCGADHP